MATITIELAEPQALVLRATATVYGLTLKGLLERIVAREAGEPATPQPPKRSGLGLLAHYGPGLSEKIDANRREMFRGCAVIAGRRGHAHGSLVVAHCRVTGGSWTLADEGTGTPCVAGGRDAARAGATSPGTEPLPAL